MHYELCIQHYFNLSSQRLDKLKFEVYAFLRCSLPDFLFKCIENFTAEKLSQTDTQTITEFFDGDN